MKNQLKRLKFRLAGLVLVLLLGAAPVQADWWPNMRTMIQGDFNLAQKAGLMLSGALGLSTKLGALVNQGLATAQQALTGKAPLKPMLSNQQAGLALCAAGLAALSCILLNSYCKSISNDLTKGGIFGAQQDQKLSFRSPERRLATADPAPALQERDGAANLRARARSSSSSSSGSVPQRQEDASGAASGVVGGLNMQSYVSTDEEVAAIFSRSISDDHRRSTSGRLLTSSLNCASTGKPAEFFEDVDDYKLERQVMKDKVNRQLVNQESYGSKTVWVECEVISSEVGQKTFKSKQAMHESGKIIMIQLKRKDTLLGKINVYELNDKNDLVNTLSLKNINQDIVFSEINQVHLLESKSGLSLKVDNHSIDLDPLYLSQIEEDTIYDPKYRSRSQNAIILARTDALLSRFQ